jgi:hypothetical protein
LDTIQSWPAGKGGEASTPEIDLEKAPVGDVVAKLGV